MKDKVYIFLSALGLVILIFVIYANVDTDKVDIEYSPNNFYLPKTQVPFGYTDARGQFVSMMGSRQVDCPQTSLTKCKSLITVGNSNNQLFFLGGSYISNSLDENNSYICGSINDLAELKGTDKFGLNTTLFQVNLQDCDSKYVPVVAPFSFTFVNYNTDNSTEDCNISISNDEYTIYFQNVANWFCAGEPEETTLWLNHHNAHYSIFGNSPNSEIKFGSKGDIIGYAKHDTIVKIVDNRTSETVSVKDFYSIPVPTATPIPSDEPVG